MRTLIRNIATLVSGDIHQPILDADSIQIEGGRITAVWKGRVVVIENPSAGRFVEDLEALIKTGKGLGDVPAGAR